MQNAMLRLKTEPYEKVFNHFKQVQWAYVPFTKGTQQLASLGNSCSAINENRLNADEDQTSLTSLEVVGEGQKMQTEQCRRATKLLYVLPGKGFMSSV